MRVFYPISARFSDITNGITSISSGWVMLWNILSLALLALVVSSLSSFETGAADKQYEHFTNHHFKLAENIKRAHAKKTIVYSSANTIASKTSKNLSWSSQDYIDAHRCAQYFTCLKQVTKHQPMAGPIKLKANDDLFL